MRTYDIVVSSDYFCYAVDIAQPRRKATTP